MAARDAGDARDALLDVLRAEPEETAVLVDYDGTLAPIVHEPASAIPLPGVAEVLAALAAVYGRVAVLSGRPVAFLQRVLPGELLLLGQYGLEMVDHGESQNHPLAGAWREVVDDVASHSIARGPRGMRVESKGLSVTLHYRGRPDIAGEVEAWAARQAARSGLTARPAKMSIELHPPIDVDKGTAVREVLDDLAAACFLGDDLGDLPAFDALDLATATGLHAVRIAVDSPEAPPQLLARADLVVDGPPGALEVLRALLPDQPAAAS